MIDHTDDIPESAYRSIFTSSMSRLTVRLDQFEGPLDLLLYLVNREKVNLLEIELLKLIGQYLELIRGIGEQEQELEAAGEFLDMASRLIHIKSVLLLPRHDDGEQERVRQELVGQLIEYSLCKEAALRLGEVYVGNMIFPRPQMLTEADKTYSQIHPASVILQAYLDAMGRAEKKRPPSPERFAPLVAGRVVSVESRIAYLLSELYPLMGQFCDLYPLFERSQDRPELIATFLAVLELLKEKRIILSEDNAQVKFVM